MNRFQTSLIASPLLLEPTWGKQALPFLENLMTKGKPEGEPDPPAEPYCLLPGDLSMASKVGFSASAGQLTAGSVAIMEIIGPIWKYGSYYAWGSTDYVMMLESLLATPEIGAIVIIEDSPGGQAAGIAELYDTIAQAEKPILTLIRDLSASAGYYAIAGATEIWASQASAMIGSIGVYTTLVDFSGFYAQMGIKITEIYSRLSPQKNIESRSAKEGDIGPMQDMLDGLVSYFHSAVKTSRGEKLKLDLADPTQGGMFFAEQAIAVGLIDQIGSLRQILARAFELATNSQSDSSMKLFNKFPALTLLAGVAATAITDEQVVAANENLEAQGIEGMVLLRTTDVEAYSALETANATLTTANATLTEQNAKLTTDNARLGNQPGATPTAVKVETETITATGGDNVVMISESERILANMKKGLN